MPALLVTGVICGHSRDGVVPGRAAMTVFTGHRTHCWYPVLVISDEYGSEAPQKEFICDNVGHRGYYQSSGFLVSHG